MKKTHLILKCICIFFVLSCKTQDDIIDPAEPLPILPQKSSYLLTLSPQRYAISLEMAPNEYKDWVENDQFAGNDAKRELIVKDIYNHFKDKFDFIYFVLNEKNLPATLGEGQFIIVSNDILGIVKGGAEQSIVSYQQKYGSESKLQGVISLNQLDYMKYGPSLHETMHRYGNYMSDLDLPPGEKRIFAADHWYFMGGNVKGKLGGFAENSLQYLGNNKYKADSFGLWYNNAPQNSGPYSDFELYLMGMIPLSSVQPFSFFDPNFIDGTSIEEEPGTVTGGNSVPSKIISFKSTQPPLLYNANKIENLLGVRIPSSTTSQKKFRALVVVITPRPLTPPEWSVIDEGSKFFGLNGDDNSPLYNFWEATKGIGYMETGNLMNALK